MDDELNEKCIYCGERKGYHTALSKSCPTGLMTFCSDKDYKFAISAIIENVLMEFSAYLHVIPELPNGHEIGMIEVNYNDEGKLIYGPMWLSRNDTDKIVKQFIEYRNKK